DAKDEIEKMLSLLISMLNDALTVYMTHDYAMYEKVMQDENYMDLLEYEARQNHFKRIASEKCSASVAGSVYCDILGNIERMGDHTCNIVRKVVKKLEIANPNQE
ncbi:MAG: PhoU domain-containing protein, partial [Erysipelotrichaceae bacterium]